MIAVIAAVNYAMYGRVETTFYYVASTTKKNTIGMLNQNNCLECCSREIRSINVTNCSAKLFSNSENWIKLIFCLYSPFVVATNCLTYYWNRICCIFLLTELTKTILLWVASGYVWYFPRSLCTSTMLKDHSPTGTNAISVTRVHCPCQWTGRKPFNTFNCFLTCICWNFEIDALIVSIDSWHQVVPLNSSFLLTTYLADDNNEN